ncbi:hypothetical protein MASR1M107_06040 [Ignavibacteriales bacterium]
MKSKNSNKNLHKANASKNDEFYTQLIDINNELMRYKEQFKGKVVFCNCDDPRESNFVKFFSINFEHLGLKKLIATHYKDSILFADDAPYKLEYSGNKKGGRFPEPSDFMTKLIGTGDFRNEECIEILKEADIVVTNPPFSLFREFVAQIIKYDKKFLILGHQNAIIYKEIFSLIKDNKLWLGYNNGGTKWFQVPMSYDIPTESRIKIENGIKYFSMGSIMWFTNLETTKRHEILTLYKKYSSSEYSKYDNYDAIEVPRYLDIPKDYAGVMGVPITFLDRYNPNQFEIVGSNRGVDQDPNGIYGRGSFLNGKETFKRLFIKNRIIDS